MLAEPRVLAFAREWTPAELPRADLRAIRAALRGLGAELVVIADSGVWSFRPDDDLDELAGPFEYSDRLAGDVALAALMYAVRGSGDAVFVLDAHGTIRFAHREPQVGPHLAEAVAAAAEAVH